MRPREAPSVPQRIEQLSFGHEPIVHQAFDRHSDPGVCLRVRLHQLPFQHCHISESLFHAHPSLETGPYIVIPVRSCRVGNEGDPESHVALPGSIAVTGRHDADDPIVLLIGGDAPAEHVRVAPQMLLPERMAHDHHVIASRLFLFLQEAPSQFGLHAHQRKETRRYGPASDVGRFARPGEIHLTILPGGNMVEHLVVLAPVEKSLCRYRPAQQPRHISRIDPLLLDLDHPFGGIERQRVQQHGIDHAEDRGVRPDGDRQDRDHQNRKSRPSRQHPPGVSNVLPQDPHSPLLFISQGLHRIDLRRTSGGKITGQERSGPEQSHCRHNADRIDRAHAVE